MVASDTHCGESNTLLRVLHIVESLRRESHAVQVSKDMYLRVLHIVESVARC